MGVVNSNQIFNLSEGDKQFKVINARYIEGYKIEFQFNNGKTTVIDLKNELWGEIFEPLKDLNYFKKFKLNPFTIEWENGADFSPEFLYENVETINIIPRLKDYKIF